MSRTKIVATYGPASAKPGVLADMLDAGLDVLRLNVSHLDPELLGETVAAVRKVAARKKMPMAVLADMPGPKVRCTACLPAEFELKANEHIEVAAGNSVSTPECIVIPYPHLIEDVKVGHELAINDGLVLLHTEEVDSEAGRLRCRVVRGGPISSRKGVSFLHTTLRIPGLTPRDRKGIVAAAKAEVDFIALSFVRNGADVRAARKILQKTNRPNIELIAKIEQHEAIDSLDEILAESDGVMVARGDMGIERPLEDVPLLQKDIIRASNRAGKVVITATQMLESMIQNSRPTRAEVSDVANAILDGTDAVMLSAETAMGQDPADAVRTMTRIALKAETRVDSRSLIRWLEDCDEEMDEPDLNDSLARAACTLAHDAKLDAVVCLSFYGTTAHRVSRYRPQCNIYALGPYEAECRQLALVWGVEAFEFANAHPKGKGKQKTLSKLLGETVAMLKKNGALKPGDRIAFLAGVPLDTPGATNYLRVVTVE